MRTFLWLFMAAAGWMFIFILITNLWVVQSTKDQIHFDINVPTNKVALVLGTSKNTNNGLPNRFFKERIRAASTLYKLNKISHILVSGDNSSQYYNEPRDMLQALGDLNVPEEDISLDFAGFRTLDSIMRSKAIFGQDSITIITQRFHCYRSLFIANHFGITAVAIPADKDNQIGLNLAIREILARTFAVVDIYLLQRKPRFLGEKITLPV